MSFNTISRAKGAITNTLLGDTALWRMLGNESDLFAYKTVSENKGGPFGAQLWLYHPDQGYQMVVNNDGEYQDSNAVVSKGIASAHAEAENLSEENRQFITDFLESRKGEGWEVVQISSGESCPSCRSKQVAFASELIQRGLITEKQFHVGFKATYQQTKDIAGFNDAPYDQAFRAMHQLGVLNRKKPLASLTRVFSKDLSVPIEIENGRIIYNSAKLVNSADVSQAIREIFEQYGDQPVAVLTTVKGRVITHALDTRSISDDGINIPEKTAIISALQKASVSARVKDGRFDSWDLEGAKLYTNIQDIGPMAYAESLWCNLSEIKVIEDYSSDVVEEMAQEVPGISNNDLFKKVAVGYKSKVSPLNVVYIGDGKPSVAHLLWQAKMAEQELMAAQETALKAFKTLTVSVGANSTMTRPISDIIQSGGQSTNYDGKGVDDFTP